jgi:hypothetical protein
MKHFNKLNNFRPLYIRRLRLNKQGKKAIPFYIEKNKAYKPPNAFVPYHVRLRRVKRFLSFDKESITKASYNCKARKMLFSSGRLVRHILKTPVEFLGKKSLKKRRFTW